MARRCPGCTAPATASAAAPSAAARSRAVSRSISIEQLRVIRRRGLVAAAERERAAARGIRAAPRACRAAGPRARGRAPAACARRGSSPRTRSPRACIPRSACARRCAAPARCASILPCSSNSSASSTVSKSIAPRFSRAAASALYSAYRFVRCGSSALRVLAPSPSRGPTASPTPACTSAAPANASPPGRTRSVLIAPRASMRMSHDHAQAIDVGLERAQLVGQLLGQHRDHAAREIHRRAALARVDGRCASPSRT